MRTDERSGVTVTHRSPVAPAAIFATLADGWSYAGWVVGNSHVREVDDGWPREGHRHPPQRGRVAGAARGLDQGPGVDPGSMQFLQAQLLWLGTAHIRVTLVPDGDGTEITMVETLVGGVAGLLPGVVQRLLLTGRNQETLRRLGDLSRPREKTG